MAVGILGQAIGTTSAVEIYTVPANTEVSNITLRCAEYSGVAKTVEVWAADDGSAAADDHLLYPGEPVSANESKLLSLPGMSTSGGKIYVAASAVTSVNFTLEGRERVL